jgi:hypothetical protein
MYQQNKDFSVNQFEKSAKQLKIQMKKLDFCDVNNTISKMLENSKTSRHSFKSANTILPNMYFSLLGIPVKLIEGLFNGY